jgi:hypothetical protein
MTTLKTAETTHPRYLTMRVMKDGKPRRTILLKDPRQQIAANLQSDGYDVTFEPFSVEASWPAQPEIDEVECHAIEHESLSDSPPSELAGTREYAESLMERYPITCFRKRIVSGVVAKFTGTKFDIVFVSDDIYPTEQYESEPIGRFTREEAIAEAARENSKRGFDSGSYAVAVEVGEQLGEQVFNAFIEPDGLGTIDMIALVRPIRRVELTDEERNWSTRDAKTLDKTQVCFRDKAIQPVGGKA